MLVPLSVFPKLCYYKNDQFDICHNSAEYCLRKIIRNQSVSFQILFTHWKFSNKWHGTFLISHSSQKGGEWS